MVLSKPILEIKTELLETENMAKILIGNIQGMRFFVAQK
jgi:hypothetical protein